MTTDWAAALDAPILSPGDVVEGAVVQIDHDGAAWVDAGPLTKSEIYVQATSASVGERVKVLVLTLEDNDGRTVGSTDKAAAVEAVAQAEAACQTAKVVTVTVTEVIDSGAGALARWGALTAFIPRRYLSDSVQAGDELEGIILDVEPRNGSLVVCTDVDQERAFTALAVGQHHQAVIERFVKGGVIARLANGITGYIPAREVDEIFVKSLPDFLQVGERLLVEVSKIDPGARRVSFSRKRAMPEAWKRFAAQVAAGSTGDLATGRVTKHTQAGVFVRLTDHGVDGFIHATRLGDNTPPVGSVVTVTIRGIRVSERRANLALAESVPVSDSQARSADPIKLAA